MFRSRTSGVLLHVTSLPSPYGVGDLGPEAISFVDFLEQSQQSLWQMLPLNMTTADTGFSPYNCLSAFAGNPLLISPQGLYQQGWLDKMDTLQGVSGSATRVDYARAMARKRRLLQRAFVQFRQKGEHQDYARFQEQHAHWLKDFCLFLALKEKMGSRPWCFWPKPLRDRLPSALKEANRELQAELEFICFCQFVFYQQYEELRRYAHTAGIQLAGDVPIYVAYDSADVWAHPRLFKLATNKRPLFKAGVPPDYFSRTGQLWGNPVYDWNSHRKEEYTWFLDRLAHNLSLFDMVRIDHFRGLVDFWQVPARHQTATRGQWVPGPGSDLFHALFKRLPFAQIFAEDLGFITPNVHALMHKFSLPGMAVLQFGFDGDPCENTHCPHNVSQQTIVYTGTHDNNTTRGWFTRDLNKKQQQAVSDYLGYKGTATSVTRGLMRLAFQSAARVAIVPMQDLLNLGPEARMNVPAKARGNWRWRMRAQATSTRLTDELASLTHRCGRSRS
jgi:4-alpha-glucanotransferase